MASRANANRVVLSQGLEEGSRRLIAGCVCTVCACDLPVQNNQRAVLTIAIDKKTICAANNKASWHFFCTNILNYRSFIDVEHQGAGSEAALFERGCGWRIDKRLCIFSRKPGVKAVDHAAVANDKGSGVDRQDRVVRTKVDAAGFEVQCHPASGKRKAVGADHIADNID